MKYLATILLLCGIHLSAVQDEQPWNFDQQLQDYFQHMVKELASRSRDTLSSITDWDQFRLESRGQLQSMLGIPSDLHRTPLHAKTTGSVEHEDFVVERIQFQSYPGLFVTGNLYIPKNLAGPAPTILYVCGHATVKKNGYNYGSKSHYQHHPAWFARHGYVCLIIDTMQLGEIEGVHHGTYRLNRWWWLSRGYTPAGVETWNGIRAIDYLCSRSEVDSLKIGMTGRSGGGAITWYVAALDDRIKVAVPVAGITDLQDHIVNDCVEGHCDCMYPINYGQWDFSRVASLIAPRPLLISNTDRDPIFPLGGVYRLYQDVKIPYDNLNATEKIGLHITAGEHHDVQELRIHAIRWFNRHLKDEDKLIEQPAVKLFRPEQLRVFEVIPNTQKNTVIDELFVPRQLSAASQLDRMGWEHCQQKWELALREKIFMNWPNATPHLKLVERTDQQNKICSMYELNTDGFTRLPVFHLRTKSGLSKDAPTVMVLDEHNSEAWLSEIASIAPENHFVQKIRAGEGNKINEQRMLQGNENVLLISHRGSRMNAYSGDSVVLNHIRRRFPLLGQSLEMMQTWDILQALRTIEQITDHRLGQMHAFAQGTTAAMLLYASFFIDEAMTTTLRNLPASHSLGPIYPGILQHLDIDATLLLVAQKQRIYMEECDPDLLKQLAACQEILPTLMQPIIR